MPLVLGGTRSQAEVAPLAERFDPERVAALTVAVNIV